MRKLVASFAVVALLALAAGAPAVVINEFMYNTDGGNYYIELYNRTLGTVDEVNVDIGGWGIYRGDGAASPAWTKIVTIDSGTTLVAGQFYLVASQDVFVAVPDQEEVFLLNDPAVTGVVEGIQLRDSGGAAKDTVLYGYNLAGTDPAFGLLTDDLGAQSESLIVDAQTIFVGGSFTSVDLSLTEGSGARRALDEAAALGTEPGVRGAGWVPADGDGLDTNASKVDFAGFETGGGSPRSMTTPVTLSVFEIR